MPGLVERRDQALGIDTAEKRKARADLAQSAHPQGGVNALADAFPNARGAPPGVEAKNGAGPSPSPAGAAGGTPGGTSGAEPGEDAPTRSK